MHKAETVAGLVVVAIGALLMIESSKLPYLVESVPGPGFLPLWIAAGILVTGAVVLFNALRGRAAGPAIEWPSAWGRRQFGVLLGALALALLVFTKLGFFITTTFFMGVVIFSLGVRSWPTLLIAPLASAGILYLVFAVWLGVPLPAGVLGTD